MMASITSLIRHWFVRTQVEFQYSKNIEFFSYPLVEGLLLFHNKKKLPNSKHKKENTLEEGQEQTPLFTKVIQ